MSDHHNHRYTTPLIFLHWLMLLVIILAYASMELEEVFPRGSALRTDMRLWHYVTGISVLWLLVLRLPFGLMVSHLYAAKPAIESTFTHWQKRLAKTMHIALYLWMFALPVVGWLLVNARGHGVVYFGIELPILITQNTGLASTLEEVHEVIAGLGYVLIGLHTAAALIHHYVVGDHTLTRMLPFLAAHEKK